MSLRSIPGWRLALLSAASAILAAPPPVRASVVVAMDLPQLTEAAEQVVVAEVLAVHAAWDAGHRRILSTVELKVAETWKGSVGGDGRFTVVQPGGTVGDVEMLVHGMPRFVAGERSVLFLRGAKGRTVVGLAQGKRDLRWASETRRWMVEVPRLEETLTIGRDGSPRQVPSSAVPLDELRNHVRRLAK